MRSGTSSKSGERSPKKTFKERLHLANVPKEYQVQFEQARLETNIVRMHSFSIYVISVQIILNIINILRPADVKSSDIAIYVIDRKSVV